MRDFFWKKGHKLERMQAKRETFSGKERERQVKRGLCISFTMKRRRTDMAEKVLWNLDIVKFL